ncbi:bifunctional (p)ppGpp synthetase/guanosine-3',5'-bis(diphosphate) 3'-pyrophosphohydrolase [Blastococcus sp. Marseille-P5729]|uniref:RelA/SpoT family protein n=1 Tax=Blastococcus sp. Marseille-P5729 TaxID=2086582 RepID=UPI000D0E4AE9|nr:bifunctional (p)ppGpp synthetase/guanosine-3',5'-bis(diphosphate) 3'-pyrophosphohydrolase [Blastococcus sp. Marseille-P5729]
MSETVARSTTSADLQSTRRRRVRNRLVRAFAPNPRGYGVRTELEPVVRSHRTHHPDAGLQVLQRAYDTAELHHREQTRRSGDPYITHPLAVAVILADLGMDTTTLVAALLHDTVEDTEYTLEQLISDFGHEVAHLVDGVTKLDKVQYGDAAQAETIRKMLLAMAKDPRVLVIKLGDRLHNMRTLRHLPPAKQAKKARETLEVLAPLAHRLGMNTVKWELEDLAFATLHSKRYDEIARLVAERTPSRDTFLEGFMKEVEHKLKESGIKATLTGRPKHYYSIYQKMVVRGREFDDIYDLVGVRVMLDSVHDCYAALGLLHSTWTPMPGRFKDYIATPKVNHYQSLHTTLVGPRGRAVELQIRTHEMHRLAEYGIAAHWRYKDTGGVGGKADMQWVRQMLEWQSETKESGDFIDTLKGDLSSGEVFAFTPKGAVIHLTGGATPVDFAYAVHTEVGHRCVGARVNGSLVPLDSTLENGDIVEILTSKSDAAGPSRDWLQFVAAPRTRTKIRHWFARERREDAIENGREALTKAMRKAGVPLKRAFGGTAIEEVATKLSYDSPNALYAAIGENHVSATSVTAKIVAALSKQAQESAAAQEESDNLPVTKRSRREASNTGITVKGHGDIWVKLARCCTPVPGDAILGFVTRGGAVSVHRVDCSNTAALRSEPERLIEVEWDTGAQAVFLVAIQVEALDRQGLLSDMTRVISDEKVNILSANMQIGKDRIATSRFTFELADAKHLVNVLRNIRSVNGVYDAYRVTE